MKAGRGCVGTFERLNVETLGRGKRTGNWGNGELNLIMAEAEFTGRNSASRIWCVGES